MALILWTIEGRGMATKTAGRRRVNETQYFTIKKHLRKGEEAAAGGRLETALNELKQATVLARSFFDEDEWQVKAKADLLCKCYLAYADALEAMSEIVGNGVLRLNRRKKRLLQKAERQARYALQLACESRDRLKANAAGIDRCRANELCEEAKNSLKHLKVLLAEL